VSVPSLVGIGTPPPLPASECAPPHGTKEGAHSPEFGNGGGGGVPVPTTGETAIALCLLFE
jgi:hypothetical protein